MVIKMRIFKKFTVVLGLILTITQTTPAFAYGEYYTNRELGTISQSELEYKAADAESLTYCVARISELVKYDGKERLIIRLIEECYDLYYDAYNAYSIATLCADRKWNEKSRADLEEATDIYMLAIEKINDIEKILYNSDYKYLLTDLLGIEDIDEYIGTFSDEETIELTNKELDLINQYNDVNEDSDASAKLFIELVEVRNKLAEKMGYESYAQYANEIIYNREYTHDEIDAFNKSVAQYITPTYYELAGALYTIEGVPKVMSEDEAVSKAQTLIGYINSELYECFDYMIENSLYDVSFSEDKRNGGYTVNLPKLSVPYIFINPIQDYSENAISSIATLVHEFGHFSAMLNDPMTDIPYHDIFYYTNIETAETQSQGLELLSEHYYGRVFGAAASYERYMLMFLTLGSIIDGCMFNEWQTIVYSMENVTVDKLNETAATLMEKYYGIPYHPDDVQEIWTSVPHNYDLPMYYISYALSGMAALELYEISLDDYDNAVDKYMKISAQGIYAPFEYVCNECGISDIPDDETVQRIVESITNNYALGYSDVKSYAWYTPYIYNVSNIYSGREVNLFMPNEPITRSEFVGVIGRMYDYYVGIDEQYIHSFSDVDENDENSKYIAWAENKGIVEGYSDDVFGADDSLTREQAAAVIYRLTQNGEVESEKSAETLFSDYTEISDWAIIPTLWAAENNIINGRDNNEFDPKTDISRAETAKIISCFIVSEY